MFTIRDKENCLCSMKEGRLGTSLYYKGRENTCFIWGWETWLYIISEGKRPY